MEKEAMGGDFAGILKAALTLPEEDMRRLAEVLARVIAPSSAGGGVVPALEQQPEETPQVGAAEWLQKIQGEPAWVQLQLLEDAIEVADGPSELQLLRAAHHALLLGNPPLAVRRAVVRVAAEYPLGICVGGLGLLFALFGLARGVFHLAF